MKSRCLVFVLLWAAVAGGWTPNDIQGLLDELPEGAVHQHVMMPMRDGTRLSTHYFLPAGYESNAYPVVLLRSAYNYWPSKEGYINDIVDQSDTNNYTYKNTNGYVYVIQDLRGDGDSETNTLFEPRLSDNEINDMYDTVESIATNTWCNGRVGSYGGSGNGMAAFMGWFSKAPHLVVCAPGNTAPNLYEHWSFENGVRRWVYDWLSYRNADTSEWPKPTLGDYCTRAQWEQILAEGVVSNHTVLIHNSDAWHNFFLDSTFETFTAMTDENFGQLIMTSGNHAGDIDDLDFPLPGGVSKGYSLPDFWDILNGASYTNPPFLTYFLMGDARRPDAEGNLRREVDSWPPPAVPTAWYMHADGTLSTTAPTPPSASLSYSYHPTNPVPSVGGNYSFGVEDLSGPLNQLVPELTNRTDILRFESAPFDEAVEITGRLEAQLYVETDVPDTTFMVKFIDIYPAEGTNDEYHAIMRESAIMGRYWGGLTNPAPMVSGTVYRLDIDMSSIALLVETNHRIAVHVTSSSDPAFEVHPNTYTQVNSYAASPTAHNTLHLSSQYPSRIILPHATTNAPTAEVSTGAVTVAEGGTASFDVWMSGPALNNVTLTVARASGDPDLTVTGGASLTFTTNTWSTPQTVTVAAAEDADAGDGTAVIEITGPNVIPASVTATEADDEVGVLASPGTLSVEEGGSASFELSLNRAPAASATVSVARVSGDTDLSVSGASQFVFGSGDWDTAQTVTIAAAEDADETGGSAVFDCTAPGAVSAQVTATEIDNDMVPVDSGPLAAWNFHSVDTSMTFTQTNASFMASGLVHSATGGVFTHSDTEKIEASVNAIKGFRADYATVAAALAAGEYFKWTVEPEAGMLLTVTNLFLKTDHSPDVTGVVFSTVSGISTGEVLAVTAGGNQDTFIDLSADSRFDKLDGPVEFRLYGIGGANQYKSMQIGDSYSDADTDDDIVLSGILYESGSGGETDTDGDGLPDDWESEYFGGPTNANPAATAANGINTVAECYIAGINPTNASSVFQISDLEPRISNPVLQWQNVSGRVYSVYWTSNLLDGFQALETNLTGSAYTDTVHSTRPQGFYRIDVEKAP